ncbi:MAG: MYXO-CTERM domain-containing protein [Myxococcota bacterium]|jgi:MYXO-CTERM domain-containing protein
MLTLTALAWLATPTAHACGGFFCNNSTPIDQSAERIVFAVDADAGTVETHVQIFYTGSAEEFAWVVPTPAQPELFLSTDQLFTELSWRLAPQFRMEWHEEGRCEWDYSTATTASGSGTGTGGGGYDYGTSSTGGVIVVDEKKVGPYDTVVLQASNEAALLDWLQEAGYDLPDTLDTALAPYIAFDAYFVALKLAKDQDAGDIAPLGMTYAGTRPMIPITLTSVAATPDMRLETYVFGKHRAVPDNYLHVQINEAAIDWFSGGSNYEDAITRAADEAGGQAFATDYSGPTDRLVGTLYSDGRWDTDALAEQTDPAGFMNHLIANGFPSNNTLFEVLEDHMPPPDGVDATSFYNCVECYDYLMEDYVFDSVAAAAAIDERVVEPMRRAEDLFAFDTVSRMTSSISPIEMTVDPMFVFNPDMGPVEIEHDADVYVMCGVGGSWWDSMRRLELPDGRFILVPSDEWFYEQGLTYLEFIEGLTTHYAKIIEDTSESGQPIILYDLLADGDDAIDNWNASQLGDDADAEDPGGCGCSSTGAGGAVGAWLVALALARRRRD